MKMPGDIFKERIFLSLRWASHEGKQRTLWRGRSVPTQVASILDLHMCPKVYFWTTNRAELGRKTKISPRDGLLGRWQLRVSLPGEGVSCCGLGGTFLFTHLLDAAEDFVHTTRAVAVKWSWPAKAHHDRQFGNETYRFRNHTPPVLPSAGHGTHTLAHFQVVLWSKECSVSLGSRICFQLWTTRAHKFVLPLFWFKSTIILVLSSSSKNYLIFLVCCCLLPILFAHEDFKLLKNLSCVILVRFGRRWCWMHVSN